MAADASAYAVLGLEPGADPTAVERAYKRLIKTHHPDRIGGDGIRAAEINRAYRELRRACFTPEQGSATWPEPGPVLELPPRSGRWPAAALGIATVAGLVALLGSLSDSWVADFRTRASPLASNLGLGVPVTAAIDPMTRPLNDAAIRAGVADAVRVAATRKESAMAEATRECQGKLRSQPSLAGIDRCAAFDDAIVELEDRDPWRDDGPFSQLAVTGRAMSAGSLLSDDYLAIDGRLDRVRLAVELALAPPEPAPEPPSKAAD